MYRKSLLIFSLLVLVLASGLVSAENNQRDVLSNGTFNDIQMEIDGANSSDTITVDGYHDGIYEMRVAKDLTFEGKNNAVFDGKNESNIMYVNSSNVEIRNISFMASQSYSIYSFESNLTLSGCTFEGSKDNAINFVNSGNSRLVITNCTFKSNYCGLTMYGNNFDIADCVFSGHSMSAITVYGSNGKLTSCNFTDNKGYSGSCISMGLYDEICTNLTISGCSFRNSHGPIYVFAKGVVIEKSTFTANTESAITIYGLDEKIADCQFIRNTASNGAAIKYMGYSPSMDYKLEYDGNEKFIVKNCQFTDNKVEYEGGAIYYVDNSLDFASNLAASINLNLNEGTIDNCTFKNNAAGSIGGAIEYGTSYSSEYKKGKYSHVTISNSRFTNNKAYGDSYGGAIRLWGSDNKVTGSEFDSNSAWQGACIFTSGANFKVDGCVFKNSQARFEGGALYYSGSGLTVTNSRFENLKATYSGGAIFAYISKKGKMAVTGSKFIKNSAESGGALACAGKLNVNKCEFYSNAATLTYAAIGSSGGRAEITNSKFTSNTAPFGIIKVTKNYGFRANTYSGNSKAMFFIGDEGNCKILDVNFKKISLIKCTIKKSKNTFTIKLIQKYTKKPLKNFRIIVHQVNLGGGDLASTNSKGIVKYKSKDSKIQVTYDMSWYNHDVYPKIKAKVKAPKVTYKYKKSKYFKLTAKVGKKPLKKIKINLKIGKKTHVVKTDKKGVAKFNTKKLTVGTHKVKITSGDSYYTMSAKSTIKIKK